MTNKILDYAKNVEKLVDPMAVGKVHYLQTKMKPLNQRLWIEGNTSIAYGRISGQAVEAVDFSKIKTLG